MALFPDATRPEWRNGWKTVLGAMVAGGTGAGLVFFVSSLFVPAIEQEFGASRGEISSIQALAAVGGFFAPVAGRLLDRFGFRRVYAVSAAIVAITSLAFALFVTGLTGFALAALSFGIFGLATGPLGYTRPVNLLFDHGRGMALGVAALGLALTTIIVPPALALLIAEQGWRAGYGALAAITGIVGLPLVLMLSRGAEPSSAAPEPAHSASLPPVALKPDRSFLAKPDFWKIAVSYFFMSIPGAGVIAAMAPMIAEEGVGPVLAASAISLFAAGQVVGRLLSGWWLDRGVPQRVAFAFTAVPAAGFLVLSVWNGHPALALVAIALIGIQQGSETDLVAYLIARRFGMIQYATIYGWVLTLAWLGNAVGVIGFGQMHDHFGSYSVAQGLGAASFTLAAFLMLSVQLPARQAESVSRS